MSAQARPTGVTIIAIVALVGGVYNLIRALAFMTGGALLGALVGGGAGVAFGAMSFVFGIVTLGVAIAELALAYGAWGLKPWGWALGVIIMLASLVWTVVMALVSGDLVGGLLSFGDGIIVPIIVLWFLNTSVVKQAFGRA